MWDWVALIDPDFMLSVVTCDQYGGWSDSGYCNKSYDKMYSEQQVAPTEAKRRQIVWAMQEMLYDQRPYLWLVERRLEWRRSPRNGPTSRTQRRTLQRAEHPEPDASAPEVGGSSCGGPTTS